MENCVIIWKKQEIPNNSWNFAYCFMADRKLVASRLLVPYKRTESSDRDSGSQESCSGSREKDNKMELPSQASMLYVPVKVGSKTELPVSWTARLRLQKKEQTNWIAGFRTDLCQVFVRWDSFNWAAVSRAAMLCYFKRREGKNWVAGSRAVSPRKCCTVEVDM